MILKTVKVENFKSIKDSNTFKVDEKVTCLVGKNEAGKTALLQAISKLNPTDSTEADFDNLDYPRHQLNEYEESDTYAPALTTTWEVSAEDIAALRPVIGPTAEGLTTFIARKGYSNKLRIDLAIDEAAVVNHLIDTHELMSDERTSIENTGDVAALRSKLEAIEDPTQRQKDLLTRVKSDFGEEKAEEKIMSIISGRLPKFAYFSEYLRMPGQVSVTDIKNRKQNGKLKPGHKVFLALLGMINRSIDDLEKITEHERLKAALEGASNRITQEIFRYWSQNRHLKVQFLFEKGMSGDPAPFNDGWILRTRIDNTRHGVTTSFDQRSAGFVWFFSFLVWFSQVKKQYGDNLIILLDEPGLSLHAKAQADLLRYIEERLAPTYQVLYTTHSPFMIDPSNLLRARTVEDVYLETAPSEMQFREPDLGTKVGDDILSTDKDTVFPLQASLGYEISQTLFIGEHTILVEGPSEILYIEWFKRRLKALGRTSLDRRWTLSPCGGIDKIPAFLSQFAGNKLHIAVLTDFSLGQRRKIRDLRESKLLKDGHVLTVETYAGQAEADIEDLVGRAMYAELIKATYDLEPTQVLPQTRPAGAEERIVKETENHFRTLPATVAEFDHYAPAEFLMQQGANYSPAGLNDALDRFEKLFTDFNAML